MFSEDGLKCHPKRRSFFKRWICQQQQKCVLFCQFTFVYFLGTTMNEWSIFWITTMVGINLAVNSVLFWLWAYIRQTSFDLSKTWVHDNNRFSTPPFVRKNKSQLIITARRIDILGLNLAMNKVSTNCGLMKL